MVSLLFFLIRVNFSKLSVFSEILAVAGLFFKTENFGGNFAFQISEDLGSDELIRRLKQLAHTFQTLGQADDESTYSDYTALAVHLVDEHYLNHQSK